MINGINEFRRMFETVVGVTGNITVEDVYIVLETAKKQFPTIKIKTNTFIDNGKPFITTDGMAAAEWFIRWFGAEFAGDKK